MTKNGRNIPLWKYHVTMAEKGKNLPIWNYQVGKINKEAYKSKSF